MEVWKVLLIVAAIAFGGIFVLVAATLAERHERRKGGGRGQVGQNAGMTAEVPAPPAARQVLIGALVWLLAAILLGGSGALRGLRPPVLLLLVASLAIVLLIASWVVPTLRAFAEGADLRILAGFHLVRFLGLYFVILGAQGLLPTLFVLTAGFGNLLVAALALALMAMVPPGRRWWIGWNLLGLLVSLSVGITAVILGRSDPDAVRILLVLPSSLIPSFVAPIAIATHVWMLSRVTGTKKS